MKTKIGYIVNNLTVGGVSTVVINLCNKLDHSIFDIHLIILSNDNQMEKVIEVNKKVNKYYFNYDFEDRYDLLAYLQNSFLLHKTKKKAKELLQLITQINVDVLHFHTLPRQLTIGILARKQNPNIKLVFTDHVKRIGRDDYKPYQRYFLTLAYRKLYKNYNLISVSKSVSNYIKSYNLNNPELLFKTLENSIDVEQYNFTNPNRDNDKSILIYIARINNYKGHNTLINAWKLCDKKDNDLLYIVGPDETNGQVAELAKNDSSIIFTGSITNVKTLLNKATIGVFPSLKEGLPIALLEMMASELPVIVSDIPELISIIRDNQEGLHFKLNNVIELKNKIEFLMKHNDKAVSLGKNARNRAIEIVQANNPILFHNQFYEKVLK